METKVSFQIQASNPRALQAFDPDDHSVLDAMQTVFPMNTEDAYMVWNGIHIPLSYKYTVSFMMSDVLAIIRRLTSDATGILSNRWPTNDLEATWYIQWTGEDLAIRSEWEAVVGNTAHLLAARPTIAMNKQEFISEWKQVLGISLRALQHAGYTDKHLIDILELEVIYRSISEPGVLYREAKD